jgi:hypothetical protein
MTRWWLLEVAAVGVGCGGCGGNGCWLSRGGGGGCWLSRGGRGCREVVRLVPRLEEVLLR